MTTPQPPPPPPFPSQPQPTISHYPAPWQFAGRATFFNGYCTEEPLPPGRRQTPPHTATAHQILHTPPLPFGMPEGVGVAGLPGSVRNSHKVNMQVGVMLQPFSIISLA
jgi:hypothetical protein